MLTSEFLRIMSTYRKSLVAYMLCQTKTLLYVCFIPIKLCLFFFILHIPIYIFIPNYVCFSLSCICQSTSLYQTMSVFLYLAYSNLHLYTKLCLVFFILHIPIYIFIPNYVWVSASCTFQSIVGTNILHEAMTNIFCVTLQSHRVMNIHSAPDASMNVSKFLLPFVFL